MPQDCRAEEDHQEHQVVPEDQAQPDLVESLVFQDLLEQMDK